MMDFIQHVGSDQACQGVLQIALSSKVDKLSETLQHGLAYIVNDGNGGHLSTPILVNMVLKHQGMEIGSSDDWPKLEFLTLFTLEH